MSDQDIRRLRRIIVGPPLARSAIEVRQFDRFQRALNSTRRSERVEPGPRRSAASESPDKTSAPPTSAHGSAKRPATATETPSPANTAALLRRAVAPAQPRAEGQDSVTQPEVAIAPEAPWMNVSFTPPPPDWDAAIVRTIAAMCRHADPSFENWSVVVPINPSALPETELRISLSPHRLQLRFHTQSTRSFDLVLQHRDALHALLEKALPFSKEIDIDLT